MHRRPRPRTPVDAPRATGALSAAVEACEPRRLFAYVAPAFADQIGLSGVLNYNTTFEDNFSGSSLDKTKWQVRNGHRWRAYKDAPVSTFSYTDESPIQVGNGELQLIAHNDATTGQLKGAFLQSGRQFNDNSRNSPVPKAKLTPGYGGDFEQAYGYWETRAKFSSLPGMWSAFWVHSYRMTEVWKDPTKADRPEIYGTEYDVVEHSAVRNINNPTPNDVTVIAHANGYDQHHKQSSSYPATANYGPSRTPPSAYHAYGMLWTSTSVKFYVDGNLVHTLTDPTMVSKVPQMALLSVEVGAGGSLEPGKGSNFFGYTPAGGYGSKAASQARATFDYVRVWQLKNVAAPSSTATASASGTAWRDTNADGMRTSDEAAYANATIFADYDKDGVRDGNEPFAFTAANGSYTVSNIAPKAAVNLTIVPVGGMTVSTPENGFAYYVTYPGRTEQRRDFGLVAGSSTPPTTPTPPPPVGTASVASVVFVDANGNGVRDSGEAGHGGATVFVDLNGNSARDSGELFATTAGDGSYRIDNLPVGVSVQIRLVGLAGYAQTAPAGNGGYAYKPYAGQLNTKAIFGIKATGTTTPPPTNPTTPTTPPAAGTASVASHVFIDANGNGVRDAGELGLANAIVFVDVNGNSARDAGELAATTASDGSYRINNLPINQSVQVRVVPISGYAQTLPTGNGGYFFRPFAGQLNTKTPFGLKPNGTTTPPPATGTASVGGVVFVDADRDGRRDTGEIGRKGARVFVDYDGDGVFESGEPSVLTGADGSYRIDGVRTGTSVAVTLLKDGLVQTAPTANGAHWFKPYAGQVNGALNFGVRAAIAVAATLAAASTKALAFDATTTDDAKYPIVTGATGTWQPQAATHWASGFYPGTLWLAYENRGDAASLDAARRFTAGLAGQQYATGGHDVGFQIFNSFGQGYRLTEDPAYLSVLLNAARSLSTRFNATTGAIRSWDWTGGANHPVIIDGLMNLELLMWAHKHGGTSAIPGYSLEQIAISHADKLIGSHFRGDGSVFHVVEFDPATGAARDPVAYAGYQQAYSSTSTWSRGQSWAIYGYTMMFRETGLTRYRDAARKAADYFLANLPEDGMPAADFAYGTAGVPFTAAQKDSGAAAIAASALIELASLAGEPKYHAAAEELLAVLTSPDYLSTDASFASVLKHGSHNARTPDDAGYTWGDYYLMEALGRLAATGA